MSVAYSEANLAKLLEYGKLAPPKMYEAMAATLGLEFYSEQDGQSPVYTICSDTFVLDITGNACSLIFVEESRNAEFDVLRTYLTVYLDKPLIFFRLLKFFVRCVDLTQAENEMPPEDASLPQRDLHKYKTFCSCLFSNDYCLGYKIGKVPHGYNIFTHRDETGMYNPAVCRGVVSRSGLRIASNLYEYFTLDDYTINTPKLLPLSPHYYYSTDKVRVTNGDVFVGSERCKVASFIFKKGGTLADALEVSARVRVKRSSRSDQ